MTLLYPNFWFEPDPGFWDTRCLSNFDREQILDTSHYNSLKLRKILSRATRAPNFTGNGQVTTELQQLHTKMIDHFSVEKLYPREKMGSHFDLCKFFKSYKTHFQKDPFLDKRACVSFQSYKTHFLLQSYKFLFSKVTKLSLKLVKVPFSSRSSKRPIF